MSRDTPVDAGIAGALRWAGAGIVAIGLHLGIGALLVGRTMLPPPPDAAQAGIPIDLEPVTVPQDETAPTPAPPPGQPQGELPLAERPPAHQAAGEPPPPPFAPEPLPPPAPEPLPRPEIKIPVEQPVVDAPALAPLPSLPDLPPTRDNDDATLARPLPVPKPVVRNVPKPVKPPPKPVDQQAETAARRDAKAREAARDERREAARQASRQRSADRRAAAASAPAQGAEPQQRASPSASTTTNELAIWRFHLNAHLERFKRSPADGGGGGTAQVTFSVSASGGVSNVRLAASSGIPALDAAAMAMIARANPVPPPPSGVGPHVLVRIPVRFSGE